MGNGTERLEERVTELRKDVDALTELVEGRQSWSHRTRLHALEGDASAAKLAKAALEKSRGAWERRAAWAVGIWLTVINLAIALWREL